MKLLLVSSEEKLANMLQTQPEEYFFSFEVSSTYTDAKERLSSSAFDVLILDAYQAKNCPVKFLSVLRLNNELLPILFVQSHENLEEMLSVFDAGADDCLSRPFHPDEFYARIRALYRRYRFHGQEELNFEEIYLDLGSREVRISSQLLKLTRMEYELLLYFLSNKNRVLGKEKIAEYLWEDQTDSLIDFDFVYQHIKNLRKKMKALGAKPYIQTVYGLGYRFNSRI